MKKFIQPETRMLFVSLVMVGLSYLGMRFFPEGKFLFAVCIAICFLGGFGIMLSLVLHGMVFVEDVQIRHRQKKHG